MLRALVLVAALAAVSPAFAQGSDANAPKAPYTIDEYVEARRPVIQPRALSGPEKAQARKLVDEINATLKKKQRPAHILMEQLAPLAQSGDKPAMKAMMMGYAEAGEVKPWPADAISITSWTPNTMLAGLWAIKLWEAGDRSKDTSKAIDNCWRKNTPLVGMCGYTIKVEDYGNPFNDHWAHNKAAPKKASFTEHTLTPSPEKQKARFDKFVAQVRAGDSYAGWDLIWAEVWANRNGGEYPALLQAAQREGSRNYRQREEAKVANAKDEREQNVAKWEKLQAERVKLKAAKQKLNDTDEAEWIYLSHWLGGKYLVPFGSENVFIAWTTIESLCREDAGPVCQRQQQLYQYRSDEARADRAARDMALRNLTLGGGDVSVRTYDQNGNYLGTASMPAWQADVVGAN